MPDRAAAEPPDSRARFLDGVRTLVMLRALAEHSDAGTFARDLFDRARDAVMGGPHGENPRDAVGSTFADAREAALACELIAELHEIGAEVGWSNLRGFVAFVKHRGWPSVERWCIQLLRPAPD